MTKHALTITLSLLASTAHAQQHDTLSNWQRQTIELQQNQQRQDVERLQRDMHRQQEDMRRIQTDLYNTQIQQKRPQ